MKRKMDRKAPKAEEEELSESDSEAELSDDFGNDSADDEEQVEDGKSANGHHTTTDIISMPTMSGSEKHQPPHKMAKLSKNALYKPPTNEELNNLKETESLFHSSLFRMQITELLTEVVLKEKRRKQINEYLHILKDTLLSLPSQKEHDITDQKWASKKNFHVPFSQTPFKVKGKFKFQPPVSVKVIGSYLVGTCVRPDVHVDLALQLPDNFLQPKDYLNQRYLRKRALYLTKLAMLLAKRDVVGEMSFTHHHGNHMKPLLVITPPGKLVSHVEIRLHTSMEGGPFKLNRFHIQKNNVRPAWFRKQDTTDQSHESGYQPATPYYNTVVVIDMVMERHLEMIHGALQDADGLRDGIALLKVWLHQRRLSQGQGSWSGFIMTMLVVHLLQQRKLNTTMSSYQVVRNTLIYIGQNDLTTKGINMATSTVDRLAPTLEEFHEAFDVVFVDPTGYVNLCADVAKSTFQRVQHEATLSLAAIDRPGLDGFEALFMKPVQFLAKFDHAFHVFKLETLSDSVLCPPDSVLDHCGDHISVLTRTLLHLVEKALSQRLQLHAVNLCKPKKWSVKEKAPMRGSDKDVITVGLLLNPETVGSAVNKGPLADSPEAAAFREFWGEKAELRRFQDGTICEAVVWKCSSIEKRRFIPVKVIKHILQRQGGIEWSQVKYIGGQLDKLLYIPSLNGSAVKYYTGEEQLQNIIQVYDGLAKTLRSLRDLPLAIHSIQGTSPSLRYADTFPPLPATAPSSGFAKNQRLVPQEDREIPPYTPSITVQCVLESSGKWPEDVQAVRRLRGAFHVQLAKLLADKHRLPAHAYPDHVLVLKDGYVFRVQIGYLREATLLKMVKTPDGMLKIHDTEESVAMETQLVGLPKMSSALHGLQQEHPSYSAAVRLAKRWISSQLLADYVTEELIELITAHLYLQPAPFSAPGSPFVAFQRWLQFIGNHDWQLAPVIVNLNRELTKKDFAEIEAYFTQHRSTLPQFFVATPYDRQRSLWTRSHPSPQMALRLVMLARESLTTLETQFLDTNIQLDYKVIFRPPLDAYSALIHLDLDKVSRRHTAVDATKLDRAPYYVTLEEADASCKRNMPVVDFDPVHIYLKELREAFGEVALFFYDPLGGKYIAVLWKQPALAPQPFKVSHITARAPDTTSNSGAISMVPNMTAILNDFKVIGAGLVTKVEQLKKS